MARVALVTGGSRGIGAAIAQEFQAAGYRVAANYGADDEAATEFQKQTRIPVFKWDVGDYDACVKGVQEVEAALGAIDVLVNNAGITQDAAFHKMSIEQWTSVIRTNLNSLYNMTRPLIEGMRARSFGRVLVISSLGGQTGQLGQVNNSAAKAGNIGFVKALAQESASKGITVNAICPGYIGTDMVVSMDRETLRNWIVPQIPVGRLGTPKEIARAAVFLASDEGGFITGSTMSLNGGQYMM